LETMLGMAGREIGRKLAEDIEAMSYQEVKTRLSKYYGATVINGIEKQYGKETISGLAQKTIDFGLPFSTPVFDGAHYEKEIQPLLHDLGLPVDGALKMYDGR